MAQAARTYSAASTILARVGITFIDFNLTVGACVSRSARTSVAPLASVGACGTILAGLVVGAVVQVCKRFFFFFKEGSQDTCYFARLAQGGGAGNSRLLSAF